MARDRFIDVKRAKALLKGTGAVAKLNPTFAKDNGIRCGKLDGKVFYSTIDIQTYTDRIAQERAESALQTDSVRLWQVVVDTAILDGDGVAEAWANEHLLEAIAESDDDATFAGDIKLM